MARVPNPYAANPLTPIGNAIAQLGSSFFAGPSPIEQERYAGDVAYKQALKDKALFDLEQGRREAAALQQYGQLWGGEAVDPRAAGPAAIAAGQDPSDLAEMMQFFLANTGAGDEALVRARAGAGGVMKPDDALTLGRQNVIRGENFGQERTLEGMEQAGALERTNAQQAGALQRTGLQQAGSLQRQLLEPVNVSAGGTAYLPPGHPLADQGPLRGVPTHATTRGELLGENFEGLSELDPTQQKALGAYVDPNANLATPRNYITATGQTGITHDGLMDSATGNLIPPGSTVFTGQVQPTDISGLTTSTKTALQGQQMAIGEFQDIMSELRSVAEADPTLFGVAGNVRRGAQAFGQQAQNVGQLMGWDVDAELNSAASALAGTAVDPQAFDPNLTDIEKLATLAAYKAASALAAQEGRGISDKDFIQFRRVVGDPTAWTASQPAFMAGLNRLESLVNQMSQRNLQMQGAQPMGPQVQPPGLPSGQPTQRIRIDESGNIIP